MRLRVEGFDGAPLDTALHLAARFFVCVFGWGGGGVVCVLVCLWCWCGCVCLSVGVSRSD